MERVARVLECLGDSDVNHSRRLVEKTESLGDRFGDSRVAGTNDKERGGEEVGDPGTFPQELWAHRDADCDTRICEAASQRRDDDILNRSRRHGATDDDSVVPRRWWAYDAQRVHDVVHGAPDV